VNRFAAPVLMLVTDRRRLSPDARTLADEVTALERWLDDAIDAGVSLIQIRERDLAAQPLEAVTRRVAARASSTTTRVLVNDRADVARAAGAHGVHLRGDSAAIARVRTLDAAWILGRSIHSTAGLNDSAGADYALFGTMFETPSKPGVSGRGIEELAAVIRAAEMPVLAIGGITPDSAARCARAGAAGIAAIRVFLPARCGSDALGPAEAVRAFRDVWSNASSSASAIC
jgi:thiamine-phosphate pyrophosphorylase